MFVPGVSRGKQKSMATPGKQGGERAGTALIVVDMLNPYEHEEADALAESVVGAVEPIAALVAEARDRELPVVYVNDNYGDWNSSPGELAERAMDGAHPELVEPLLPPDDAMFVIKARHTIFYETPLNYLLTQLGVEEIVLAGQVTEQCILYSALDAYVRHLAVRVPRDCVAHIHADLAGAALEMMERNMDARISDASDLDALFPQPETSRHVGGRA
jgi:nicotinamidase-related amidase